MTRNLLAAALAIAVATPALALSCLPPDAVRLYETARDAAEPYYVVKGRIEVTGAFTPPVPDSDQVSRTEGKITGQVLTSHGFGVTFSRPIVVETSCLGPWCSSVDGLGGEMFAALRVDDDALVLRIGPCGGDVVAWDKSGERRLLDCHRGGACVAAGN